MSPNVSGKRVIWKTVEAVCLVLVVSFILFEVLDVDCSNFPSAANAATIKLADPPQEMRRVNLLLLPTLLDALPSTAQVWFGQRMWYDESVRLAPFSQVVVTARDARTTLPRASLSDPALAA
jgi:hypothetical protein